MSDLTFTVYIRCESEAFEDSPSHEIARILTNLAYVIVHDAPGTNAVLRDVNGNQVGRWELAR
jgi:hypothetical protein